MAGRDGRCIGHTRRGEEKPARPRRLLPDPGRLRERRRLRRCLRQLAPVQGLPVRQPAQPADASKRRHLEDLVALPRRQEGRHGSDRPDSGAAAHRGPARGPRSCGQPPGTTRPFLAPAEARRQVLADRSGVRRARVAGRLRRAEALPSAAAVARAAAGDRGPDPLARPLRPSRPADHRVPGAAGAALLRAARGEGAAPGDGRAGGAGGGIRLVAGRRPCRRAPHGDAGPAPTATAPCGPRG